jgi:uncharacterized DUF497 family protein
VRFEWDPAKAASNAAKHGVTFEEATEVFANDAVFMELLDEKHSAREPRYLRIGAMLRGVVLVVWTERYGDVVRIISARFASRAERGLFGEYLKKAP